MTWQPQQQGLEEVLAMLRQTSSSDSEVQRQVTVRLNELRYNPDFLAYLVHVLIVCTNETESHRAVAGLLIKNTLVHGGPFHSDAGPEAMAYVKATILSGLADSESMIRQTSSAVISSLLGYEEAGGWPEALDAVTKGLNSPDGNVAEGCFQTVTKLAEDCPHKLDFSIGGQNLLDIYVPEFIKFMSHNDKKIRFYCMRILQALSAIRYPAMNANIDAYLQACFARASDESPDVRRLVCSALGMILNTRADKLIPQMTSVVDYMSYCMADKDEAVALEACEFWLTFAEDQQLREILKPHLGKVAPLLLQGMVYSDMDLLMMGDDEDDEAVPDREEDIKPKAYGGKTHGSHEMNEPSSTGGAAAKSREAAEKALEEDEEDEESDDEWDEDEGTSEWNIRKCSAAALDVMAVSYGSDLLEVLLPHLKDRLFSEEWVEKESGVLALGAIAEGCMDGLEQHLPQLVPWLLGTLTHTKALVRSITCWTIGRYSSWCVRSFPDDHTKFLLPTMEGLLKMVLDGNKRVQEAGCSAFATLEEEAGPAMVPFLEPILRNLVFAFNKYQQKNLLILYDALGTLADSVGPALGAPLYMEILMPPLIDRWLKLSDDHPDLVPLLECLSSVSIAAGVSFAPYTEPVFTRCLQIIQSILTQYQMFESDPGSVDEPDRTFIVVALDLLSGLTQGLGTNIGELVQTKQPSLINLMAMCLTHYEPPIRQSAHALLGDMAISCFPLLKPIIPTIMPSVIEQIVVEPEADCVSVCNNAAWAAGEIALQFVGDSAALEPFVPAITARLIPILLNSKSPKSLTENAAVTIGRLGLVAPQLIAPQLGEFAQAWCTALWDIKDNEEKDSAFRGFCMMISVNPQGIEKSFLFFCNAVVRWQNASPQLESMFRQLLQGFKSNLGPNWETMVGSFPPVIRQRLQEKFQV